MGPAPSGERVVVAVLAISALAFSGWYSYRAPCGSWENRIFDTPRASEADPGAFYVFQAFQLDAPVKPIFHGHPGTPLLLLLDGLQRAYYHVAAPAGVERGRFIAQNLPQVFWLSKMMMTVIQLLGCWALFRVANAILADRRAALFAAIGYGTTFPVLCHLSRIFPEPLAIAFCGAAFLAYWRYEALAAEGRTARGLAFIGLAGVLSVSAAVTKIMVLGPLPIFLAAMALVDLPRRLGTRALSWRVRLSAAAVISAASAVALSLYSRWIDWPFFFWFWRNVPAAKQGPQNVQPMDFLPGFSASNLLPTAELGFVAVSIVGGFLLLRARGAARSRALAFSLYGVFGLLVFVYRASLLRSFLGFHYAYLPLFVLAPFFGWGLAAFERRFVKSNAAWAPAAFALCAVLLLHGLSGVAVVGSRQHDAEVFAPNRDAYRLISELAADGRLLVEARSRRSPEIPEEKLSARLSRLHGWPPRGLQGIGGPPPLLREAFDALFTARAPRRAARGEPVLVPLARVRFLPLQ